MARQTHPVKPVYDNFSKILILGSFPSVKSREERFFYAHPQNRFWRTLSVILNCELPLTIDEKQKFLLKNNIALWDVIQSCDIEGSSDSSLKNVVPNDFSEIFSVANIRMIFANGSTSFNMFKKYSNCNREIIKLPSTSPANAMFSLEKLIDKWGIILDYL